jgi:small-conductance mechanosensitive channel
MTLLTITAEGTEALTSILDWLTRPLFNVGGESFSAATILKLLVFIVLVAWVARLIRRILIRRVFPRARLEVGVAHAIGNIFYYVILSLGLIVGLQATGIDLSTLTLLFGAVGVGIGFGLQNIVSNFISGLIILFERPIQVGDRIQIGDLHARVERIRARATEVVTNDGIVFIVPNSEFITLQVINWSKGEDRVRLRVPVGVSYASDVGKVREALLEAAASVDAMLKNPPPEVRFLGFGDSSLNFELLGWTTELLHSRGRFVSQVNFAIHEALRRHGIEIPFPQRDLHLRSPLPLEVASSPATGQ